MNANVQAGVVQLGIAALLVVTWYTGAWQVIVDELRAGITGTGERRLNLAGAGADLPARSVGGSFGTPPAPAGLRAPSSGSTARLL